MASASLPDRPDLELVRTGFGFRSPGPHIWTGPKVLLQGYGPDRTLNRSNDCTSGVRSDSGSRWWSDEVELTCFPEFECERMKFVVNFGLGSKNQLLFHTVFFSRSRKPEMTEFGLLSAFWPRRCTGKISLQWNRIFWGQFQSLGIKYLQFSAGCPRNKFVSIEFTAAST